MWPFVRGCSLFFFSPFLSSLVKKLRYVVFRPVPVALGQKCILPTAQRTQLKHCPPASRYNLSHFLFCFTRNKNPGPSPLNRI